VKIVLLSGASTIHTIRWANGLQAAGLEVHVVSQHPELEPFADGVQVHLFPFRGVLGYFTMVPRVKKLLDRIKPDLVNAHYASGYATTARLVGYHPWLLSVWGSDVYDVPYKSPLHKWLVRRNLSAADAVASTSHCMAEQTRSLLPALGHIAITPFGVDIEAYAGISPSPANKVDPAAPLVVGTVKTMAPKYGIDTLIQAFAIVRRNLQQQAPALAERLVLRLIGDGPQTEELKALADHEGITEVTTFTGRVPHLQVPEALAELDVYVALSRLDSESFGVAIIEAGAAGRPVVVSDAGGLPEVVLDGETGLVVPREKPEAAAKAILRLLHDPVLREYMGAAGQRHVSEHYGWPACIAIMKALYRQTIDQHSKD
jgi:glycosyltransferase involved in cell wall biosynthesis